MATVTTTYFFIADNRAVDRTQALRWTPPEASSSNHEGWRWTPEK